MGLFRETLDKCELTDLGYTGNPFTWSNSRIGSANVLERLDHAVATQDWKILFPSSEVRHLPMFRSDHTPIFLVFDIEKEGKQKREKIFCLEHMWLHHPDFKRVMKTSWQDSDTSTHLIDK